MTPDRILANLIECYSTSHTYQDTGWVATKFVHNDGQSRTSHKPFSTTFVRLDGFRFECKCRVLSNDPWERHLIWARGNDVRTWWDATPGVNRKNSLAEALDGATGVSGGSARTIPALLMPDLVGPSRLTRLARIQVLDEEWLGEVKCYKLTGRFEPPLLNPIDEEHHCQEFVELTGRLPERVERSPLTVWVDEESLLVLRIEEVLRFEPFRAESVTMYDPLMNVEVPPGQLHFNPPRE